ncbi:MAG: UDP-N-acetylmuramoyl-L-alanyl-D-glutamate--2,6-diaminopimelate ligase [Alphaproteobacteria bacterium]|nr:UDP-N-acetylmuramoyl-L-alanyl-D-glutamate--2,6-diaminopimelate ligase [Alphaproteobacteria bacterium]
MQLSCLLKEVSLECDLKKDIEVTGIAVSSKEVNAGDIFVPIKGAKSDGLDFLNEAIEKGAVAVLSDREIETALPMIKSKNLSVDRAKIASVLYPTKKIKTIAVTGTNGKTSTAYYVYQLLNAFGYKTASIGTLGVYIDDVLIDGKMTTPDSISLAKTLFDLEEKQVEYVVLEASSHGLVQNRLASFSFESAGFTNLTRDHLDYHGSMEEYFKAKKILFQKLLKQDGLGVLNADDETFEALSFSLKERNIKFFSYGFKGDDLKIEKLEPLSNGQSLVLNYQGKKKEIHLNIFGAFQVHNILCALGLVAKLGLKIDDLIDYLPKLKAPAGRLECVGYKNGANIFVDYAHTPDALYNVLKSLRVHTKGRLVALIGCGGNRDTGKRYLMGDIAQKEADAVFITDDNPRFEEPSLIREMIFETCPKAVVIPNRKEAIYQAIVSLNPMDTLIICGKGHESGQLVNGVCYPFSDKNEALAALNTQEKQIIWEKSSLEEALQVFVDENIRLSGISIDTRSLKPGDLFLALKGEKVDGHKFVKIAIQKGAGACLVEKEVEGVQKERQIIVPDVLNALEKLAEYRREKSKALFVGITGSSGKTTTKEMLKTCLSKFGLTHATKGNFNNEIGVPITLASMHPEAKYGVIELGMNHKGEISKLTKLVKPDVSIITMVGSAHREFFKSEEEIALAKSEIFEGQKKGAVAVLNKESPFFKTMERKAFEAGLTVVSFGGCEEADFKLNLAEITDKCKVLFERKNQKYSFEINFLGRHFAMNSLAVLAGVEALGLPYEEILDVMKTTAPIQGRGLMKKLIFKDHKSITLIDDCYNANPSSMQASLAVLSKQTGGRKVAVLGQMLELGDEAVQMHKDLLKNILENQIDRVYTIGTLMKYLYELLPSSVQGGYFETVEEMMQNIYSEINENDIILVKGSNSVGLNRFVKMLQEKC